MTKTIFEKQWTSPVAWGVEGTPRIEGYIKYQVHFDFKNGLRFSITVPNYGYCTRSPLKCIFGALEHSSVGMGKYCRLKDRVRSLDLWRKL